MPPTTSATMKPPVSSAASPTLRSLAAWPWPCVVLAVVVTVVIVRVSVGMLHKSIRLAREW